MLTPPSATFSAMLLTLESLTLFYGCSSVTPALASNAFSFHNNDSSTETGFYTIGSNLNVENNRTCNFSITVPVLQTAA